MKRHIINARPDWQRKVEALGLVYHSPDDVRYWNEEAYYEFTSTEIDEIERATYKLNEICLDTLDRIITQRRFERFGIPAQYHDLIVKSWDIDEITLLGRFDLAYNGKNPPVLLEYNADTPTSLPEAAVVQWHWLEERFPDADQFNSIHDRLREAFDRLKNEKLNGKRMYFSGLDNWEDFVNVTYLRDLATQAGIENQYIAIGEVGWNDREGQYRDTEERPIEHIFKLYAWEWMLKDAFANTLLRRSASWYEAPWKMLLSNKAILPYLWQYHSDCPYLVPASFEPMTGSHVKKPILSREGANVELVDEDGAKFNTDGKYGAEGFVYQRHAPLYQEHGYYAVVGSWMVNGYAAGIGIREDESPITGNFSRFTPHLFR